MSLDMGANDNRQKGQMFLKKKLHPWEYRLMQLIPSFKDLGSEVEDALLSIVKNRQGDAKYRNVDMTPGTIARVRDAIEKIDNSYPVDELSAEHKTVVDVQEIKSGVFNRVYVNRELGTVIRISLEETEDIVSCVEGLYQAAFNFVLGQEVPIFALVRTVYLNPVPVKEFHARCVAIEFAGEDLRELKTNDEQTAIKLLLQGLMMIDTMNEKGILHSDLHLNNITYTKDKERTLKYNGEEYVFDDRLTIIDIGFSCDLKTIPEGSQRGGQVLESMLKGATIENVAQEKFNDGAHCTSKVMDACTFLVEFLNVCLEGKGLLESVLDRFKAFPFVKEYVMFLNRFYTESHDLEVLSMYLGRPEILSIFFPETTDLIVPTTKQLIDCLLQYT